MAANDNGPIPPQSVQDRINQLAAKDRDGGFLAVSAADLACDSTLAVAMRLAAETGGEVGVVIDGMFVTVLPPER